MSHLNIVDLSFCDRELPSSNKVQGGIGFGITVYSPTGAFSTGVDSSSSSGYFTNYFFDLSTGAFGYEVGYGYSWAVAGAAAGAASDGSYYVSAYASASA